VCLGSISTWTLHGASARVGGGLTPVRCGGSVATLISNTWHTCICMTENSR